MLCPLGKPQPIVTYDKLEISDDVYIAHDNEFDGGKVLIKDPHRLLPPDFEKCTYCSTALVKVKDREYEQENGHLVRDYCLWYCRNCRFWQYRLYYDNSPGDCLPGPEHWVYVSKLREFESGLPECCNSELVSYIRRNPDFMHFCSPKYLEELVADVFRANFTNAEVMHIGKPDDGGVDVLFIDSEGQQWLIQVKRRETPKKAEGVSTIRNLLGAMVLEGALKGILVSTANQFSLRARQAAARAGQVGLTI